MHWTHWESSLFMQFLAAIKIILFPPVAAHLLQLILIGFISLPIETMQLFPTKNHKQANCKLPTEQNFIIKRRTSSLRAVKSPKFHRAVFWWVFFIAPYLPVNPYFKTKSEALTSESRTSFLTGLVLAPEKCLLTLQCLTGNAHHGCRLSLAC